MESLIPTSTAPPASFSRRDILRLSAAWGLSFAIPGLSPRAAQARGPERAKSLILLWMGGGPSQLETWDPHPAKLGQPGGSQVGAIKTSLKGAEIADLFPQTADVLHEFTVLRSLVSKEGDHERGTYTVKTGYRPDPTLRHPTLAAIIQHELLTKDLKIPNHVTLCDSEWPSWGGYLGAANDAFKVYQPGNALHNLEMGVAETRRKQRRSNLSFLEESFKRGRGGQFAKTLHVETLQQALAMMDSEQMQAFKINSEPESLKSAYGDTNFGRGCLVARRLIETGVRAVEISLNGWDTHAQNLTFHQSNAAILDPALSTLMRDLRDRDLLDSTIVLCIGEFGRTPKVNPLEGRDHWPNGFSCLVGGGGLKVGQVIGETDPNGKSESPKHPIHVPDLYATLLQQLGIEHNKEVITPIGRPMAYCSGNPLKELLSG